ncbi:head completion/stabilization protein [Shewanella xiamenensis]|uniref:Head completion/stabilization protein n=1 Tax=Shewanella xiamenensis TaxID=332186 RepID=A0AAE4Q3X6_9GAMM|nr:head completion/stabilization protein [Shewanella xiamenensis]MDV5392269.1 head completion/stabilization protein [Shewanella xiamenensis]
MSFIAPATSSTASIITNDPFWPDIEPDVLRQTMRLDGTVTNERLEHAVINAALQVNSDLKNWRIGNQLLGFDSLVQVPAEQINGQSIYLQLYLRAVYCLTKANLIERYSDFDSTAKGLKAGEELTDSITDLRRDARFAIRDILGESHVTVELI